MKALQHYMAWLKKSRRMIYKERAEKVDEAIGTDRFAEVQIMKWINSIGHVTLSGGEEKARSTVSNPSESREAYCLVYC